MCAVRSLADVSVALTGGVAFQPCGELCLKAVCLSRCMITNGLCLAWAGNAVAIRAAVADTCGVAIDVPWIEL